MINNQLPSTNNQNGYYGYCDLIIDYFASPYGYCNLVIGD